MLKLPCGCCGKPPRLAVQAEPGKSKMSPVKPICAGVPDTMPTFCRSNWTPSHMFVEAETVVLGMTSIHIGESSATAKLPAEPTMMREFRCAPAVTAKGQVVYSAQLTL